LPGSISRDIHEVDLNAGIQSTPTSSRSAKKRQVTIDLQLEPLPMVNAFGQVNQVVMNLLSNAIEATRSKESDGAHSRDPHRKTTC